MLVLYFAHKNRHMTTFARWFQTTALESIFALHFFLLLSLAAFASAAHIYNQNVYYIPGWEWVIIRAFLTCFLFSSLSLSLSRRLLHSCSFDSLYVSLNDYITTWIIYAFAVYIWIESAFSNVLQNVSTQLLS